MKTSQTSFFQQSPNDLLLSKSSSAICYLYGKNGLPDGIILTSGILCLKITNKKFYLKCITIIKNTIYNSSEGITKEVNHALIASIQQ